MTLTQAQKQAKAFEDNKAGFLKGLQNAKEYRYIDEPDALVEAEDFIGDTLRHFTEKYADLCEQWQMLRYPNRGEFSALTEAMIAYLQHIVEIMSVD